MCAKTQLAIALMSGTFHFVVVVIFKLCDFSARMAGIANCVPEVQKASNHLC